MIFGLVYITFVHVLNVSDFEGNDTSTLIFSRPEILIANML
jgi:hypothetical protein